jgi:hypothetical protein
VIDWLHDLPLAWLIVVVFAGTLLVTAATYYVVVRVAVRKGVPVGGVSPGMLPPMALVFGLIVGFLVAGLWADVGDARDSVNREASALRSAQLIAAAAFPGRTETQLDTLIRRHIQDAASKEWPAMADRNATLTFIPVPLAQALQLSLALKPVGPGQATAQRELVSAFENALDARRQRIIVSHSTVNWVKWAAVIALAFLTLVAIACVHSGNPVTAAIAMGIFGAAVAVTLILIASQDRPFSGQFGVKPDVLEQVLPRATG